MKILRVGILVRDEVEMDDAWTATAADAAEGRQRR